MDSARSTPQLHTLDIQWCDGHLGIFGTNERSTVSVLSSRSSSPRPTIEQPSFMRDSATSMVLAATTDAVIADIISHLPAIYPAETDSICWRTPSGRFTLESATLLIQPATPRVQWHGLLRGKYKIARHSFILWMAILEKLSTMDKPWIPRDDDGCVLCNGQFDETHSHLFLTAGFREDV
ncbi:UNVERIFIED_CONTAM: hypothetical protein Scaly_3086800 [Sesamum calycinum]|uniref:Reverse transcriptase zinc-binding domain-containing protein n=1 Tax=Sesamum calycinum TaxID=2727403 RepID=A0AAW2JQ64_9LAMI